MRKNRFRRRLIARVIVIIAASPAFASGFSIYEQDAKASAMAGAWTARADNAAANWYNPAAMVRQESSFQVGINAITLGANTTFTLPDGVEYEPESSIATPFHLYYVQRASKRVAWGFGINTPFGLTTEWTTDPITRSARKSELVTVMVNPNVSLAFDDHVSFAFGISYIYADIKNFSRDLPPNPAVNPVGTQNLSGDGHDWGLNMALQYDDEDFKFGISWRSRLSPEINGELTFTDNASSTETMLSKGQTDLNLPDQIAVGFAYTGSSKWEIEFDISWARWSRFSELNLQFDDPVYNTVILEKWHDTHALRLGGSYDFSERHEMRFGILRDQNPIPSETLRPSIPDAERRSLTLGYGYKGPKIDLDVYYMALFFEDRTVNPSPANQPGVFPGEYQNFSHLFGVTFGWRFGGGS